MIFMTYILRTTTILLLLVACSGSASAFDVPWPLAPRDFLEYWSAAHVHLNGQNPYDGDVLLPLQIAANGDPTQDQAIMLWNPPWTLPLYIPFAAMPIRSGQQLWLVLQVSFCLLAVVLLWNVYQRRCSEPPSRIWLPILLLSTCIFAPVWWLVSFSQNDGWVLIGLVGFLYFRVKGYPIVAGILAALTAIKPHLLLLFGLALLWDVGSREGRRALFAGIGTIIVASLLALIPNPHVFGQFLDAISSPSAGSTTSVRAWELPLFAYDVRLWLDTWVNPNRPDDESLGFFWIMFVPIAVVALVWIVLQVRRTQPYDWDEAMPGLVLVSLLCAPYGAWTFDMVLLIVPWVHGLHRALQTRRLIPILVGFMSLPIMGLISVAVATLKDGVWFAPTLLIWWLVVVSLSPRSTQR